MWDKRARAAAENPLVPLVDSRKDRNAHAGAADVWKAPSLLLKFPLVLSLWTRLSLGLVGMCRAAGPVQCLRGSSLGSTSRAPARRPPRHRHRVHRPTDPGGPLCYVFYIRVHYARDTHTVELPERPNGTEHRGLGPTCYIYRSTTAGRHSGPKLTLESSPHHSRRMRTRDEHDKKRSLQLVCA